MGDTLKVVARVRPYLPNKDKVAPAKISLTSDSISCEGHTFQLDKVFNEKSSNEDVYMHAAHDVVLAAMDGYNGTIFTYGQTSSGKTYTVNYLRLKAIESIYEYIENCPSREFLLRMSYLELYNEKFQDLLTDEAKLLVLRENLEKHVYLNNLSKTYITSLEQVTQVLSRGDERRHFAETLANDCSSRSHCIFTIIIESRLREDANLESSGVFVSNLNIIDLAGSEKASENANKDRFNEGCNINKSLLTLSQVIRKLSEDDRHINYRDSKLTRYLQNALGGNSKTAIILTISPTSIEETISTLKFGQSAKKIKNRPEKNEVLSENAELKRALKEIEKLKENIRQLAVAQPNKELEEQRVTKQRIEELLSFFCVSSKVTKETKKEKNRRQTVCVPQFSRFRVPRVDVSPVRVLPSASIASNVCLSEPWTPSKIDQLDLSFKDYEKLFIQEDAIKKIHAQMKKLELENKHLKEQLWNQKDSLQDTKEPSLVFNESLMADDVPIMDQESFSSKVLELSCDMLSTNQRRQSGVHWLDVSSLNHNHSRAPGVETVIEEEEISLEGQTDLAMYQTKDHNLEHFISEIKDMGLQTEDQFNDLKLTQEMVLNEQKKLAQMKEDIEKQETYLESRIDHLTYLEELKDEIEERRHEIESEKASVLQEKKHFEEEKEAWEIAVKKCKDELKSQQRELENMMTDLKTKEKNLTHFISEKHDISLQTEDQLNNDFNEVESKMDQLNHLKELKVEIEERRHEIQSEKSSVLQEKKHFEEEKEAWEIKVKKCKDELKSQERELENMMTDLKTKEKNLTHFISEKHDISLQTEDQLNNDFNEVESKMDQLNHLEELKVEIEERRHEIQSEKASVLEEKKDFEEEKEAWEKEVIKTKNKLKSQERELENMVTDLKTKEKNLTHFISEKHDISLQTEDQLNNDFNEVESKMDQLNHLEELKVEIEERRHEIQSEKASVLEEKKDFEEEKEAWEKEVIKTKNKLKSQERELENMVTDLKTKEKNLTHFISEKHDISLQTEDQLNNDFNEVESKMDQLNHLEELKVEIEERRHEIQSEKASVLQEKKHFEEEKEAWEIAVKKCKDELKSQQRELENMMTDLKTKEKNLTHFISEKHDTSLQTEDQLNNDFNEVESKMDDLNCIKELRRTIEYGKMILAEKDEDIETLTLENEELERERSSLQSELSDLTAEMEKKNSAFEEIQTLTLENEELERERSSLQSELSDLTAEMEKKNSAFEEIQTLTRENEELERERSLLRSKLSDLTAELEESRAKQERLNEDLRNKKEEIKTLQVEKDALKEKIFCLKDSLEKDTRYYQKAIDNLKRSQCDNDGSFLQQKSHEPTELQIRKRLDLEFGTKIKDLEMANSKKAKEISELKEQLSQAKASDGRTSHVLKEINGCANAPRDQELERENSHLKEKYNNLKKKFIKAYDLGHNDATKDCPKCASIKQGGGAVEVYKLAMQDREITKQKREIDRLKEALKRYSQDTTE